MSFIRNTLVFLTTLLSLNALADSSHKTYAPSEHIATGENIHLSLDANTDEKNPLLHLPNGLILHYAELIALGDFYGIEDKPISLGQSTEERKIRFKNVFATLAYNDNAKAEAIKILEIARKELQLVRDGIAHGEKPEDIYARVTKENDMQYNCITGGGCTPATWLIFHGRYLKLAAKNFDHFGKQAWLTYSAGHKVALEIALAAHNEHDSEKLELAYAVDAFASHFITDRFSAGHIRTPRLELANNVMPNVTGSILANYMHNEESTNGIHVHNQNGEHWIAYGDSAYFNPGNQTNVRTLEIFLQHSVDEIYKAYSSGTMPTPKNLAVFLPEADEEKNAAAQDISSLFYWDDRIKKLMRRSITSNTYNREWTNDWWGWSTLIQLSHERGLPLRDQALLAQSHWHEKARQDGLITDKTLLASLK